MGVFRQFPYSNFHEMNMDEIIKIIKNMLEEWAQYHAEWDQWMADLEASWTKYQDDVNAQWAAYQNTMNTAWQSMQNFINNYFDNLDVQDEINNKIVSMIQTGEFGMLVNEYIPPAVNSWLNLNITQPTGVVIDTSLSVAGACADAKATGDAIKNVKDVVNDIQLDIFPVTLIENEAIDHEGVIAPYNGWSRTEYIPVTKYQSITASCDPATSYNMFYDIDKVKIGTYFSVYSTDTELEIPENAAYVIFSNTTAGMATFEATAVSKSQVEFDNLIRIVSNVISESSFAPDNDNVLNPNNFTLKGYLDPTDGETFIENNNYMCTENYIDIPFGIGTFYAKYPQIENNDRIACFLFYDADNNFKFYSSSRSPDEDYTYATINTSNDVSKFKFWANKTTVEDGSNEVELSFSYPDTFEKYSQTYKLNNTALETPEIYLPLSDKTIVCFGDSIFGNKRSPFGVTDALKEITGANIYNMGFGGCGMASRTSGDWDAFSMYRLAYAIAHNDFTVQNAVDIDNVVGMQSYFKTSLATLKTINFANVDYITIAYGTNDFTGDTVINNPNNPTDCDTFKGALRYSLQQIITAFPHIKIFVCGQTWRFWLDADNVYIDSSDEHVNGNGDKLTDFVTATEEVSESYHVPFIDNYYSLGINYFNRTYYFPEGDGTHQNYLGAKLIADHIKHELF